MSLKWLTSIVLFAWSVHAADLLRMNILNNCEQEIWVESLNNPDHAPHPDGVVHLARNQSHDYYFPNGVWAGRFWAKIGCDAFGRNCTIGQSMAPCPPSGCHTPGDTKIEFNFQNGDGLSAETVTWYDVSLVDGYGLAATIIPRGGDSGSCVTTHCDLSFDLCPQDEIEGLGDLRVFDDQGNVIQCLSPCKKFNWPQPIGLGKDEALTPGNYYCCPAHMTADQCRPEVKQTHFVDVVRRLCPTAYSWAYDDDAGLHTCPPSTVFDVIMCPEKSPETSGKSSK
jgi:hypothetical protein